ncbi:MAG: hypothetical protein CSA55_02420 [Ilumatobacter coccineus]|uniref:Uncharacterized protein n=1 Tax=Ilumatobacter coccineus TaxID=467094 RepID=A0A2G6KDN1_9ACTN|nr:MAG: hypothetical protein CSA55_02420 [Ilumatobacter coccineus]
MSAGHQDGTASASTSERSAPRGAPGATDARPSLTAFGDADVIQIPEGTPGELSVVAVGEDTSHGYLSVIVRNNTAEAVGSIEAAVEIHSDGEVIETTTSQQFIPWVVEPGEIAFGRVGYSENLAREDITYDLRLTPSVVIDAYRGVPSVEVNNVDVDITGTVKNTSQELMNGPIGLAVACFDESGTFLGNKFSIADEEELEPGATGSFKITLLDLTCDNGLMSASGYHW